MFVFLIANEFCLVLACMQFEFLGCIQFLYNKYPNIILSESFRVFTFMYISMKS